MNTFKSTWPESTTVKIRDLLLGAGFTCGPLVRHSGGDFSFTTDAKTEDQQTATYGVIKRTPEQMRIRASMGL